MVELSLKNDPEIKTFRVKNVSFFGFFTCLATFVLAFLFKDYLINLLNYLEIKSNTNIFEFHLILLFLFVCVSLPILWGYLICVLICAFVYSFMLGFILVVIYSGKKIVISFWKPNMSHDCSRHLMMLYDISISIETNVFYEIQFILNPWKLFSIA